MEKKRIVILDANSLLNRAFYALPPMATSSGEPTGAVYGFTTMLFKIINEVKPDYIAAAFDKKVPTFRHIEYKAYKAGRKKMPAELGQQFEPVKKILSAFNIGIFDMDGYEADDILGTIANHYESEDLEVIIFTGDRDALQLVSDYTRVMITKKGISETDIYTEESITSKYGIGPEAIVDLKGLMGDSSDNIPGVSGIGEKTAVKLLKEYGTLENIYANIDSISGKKLKENLITYREDAFLSKKLATIERKVPIEVDLESLRIEGADYEKLRELFVKFEFNSLLDKIKDFSPNSKKIKSIEYKSPHEITYLTDTEGFAESVKQKGVLNFCIITDHEGIASIVMEKGNCLKGDEIKKLKEILEDSSVVKNSIYSKQSWMYFIKKGINLKNLAFDAEIAAYLLNPSESKYDIPSLLYKYTGETLHEASENRNIEEAAAFVNSLDSIKEKMMTEIRAHDMIKLFHDVEMPLVEVLAHMEIQGFKVERETLNQIGFNLSEEIDILTAEIYGIAGEEFNINSPKQLGVILFEKLGLPVIRKTKTGYSTDAEVLEELSSKHEIIEKILNFRQLVKLKSTYIDGLLNCVHEDNKIHSSLNQTVTTTGRLSSTEPNLQNIPIKMEQGRQIRKAFVPSSKDYVILSGDYSQIELRVLAHISSDPNLIDAFNNGQDIHTRTASEVFGIPMNEVTTLYRSRAKAVNFGIVYGLSDFGLSKDLKISIKEAKRYIDNYFERYIGVKNYMDSAILTAKEKGYVSTLMNRIRYIPEINASNRNVKSLGERLAMNTPIQGSAADVIKIAMVSVFNKLKENGYRSKLILQVHDELVLEVHREEIETVKALVKREMENVLQLSVPLIVDIKVGETWYEAK